MICSSVNLIQNLIEPIACGLIIGFVYTLWNVCKISNKLPKIP
jgi:hypothetical protein